MPTADRSALDLAYSWDGEKDRCVHAHPERMQLASADGVGSLIVEAYHRPGDQHVSVVPDCLADRKFRFFTLAQETYLRSMIAFKYQANLDGTKTALILSLDTDEADYFSDERTSEISAFLVEMMKRFEYEVLSLELSRKIPDIHQ
jgi:hypothetical protein